MKRLVAAIAILGILATGCSKNPIDRIIVDQETGVVIGYTCPNSFSGGIDYSDCQVWVVSEGN